MKLRWSSFKGILFGVAVLVFVGIAHLTYQITIDGTLYEASGKGNRAVVVRMLRLGADPNTTDGELKVTALMEASGNGHLDVVRELLREGANPNLVDIEGRTALQGAANYGHSDVVVALKRAGAKQ